MLSNLNKKKSVLDQMMDVGRAEVDEEETLLFEPLFVYNPTQDLTPEKLVSSYLNKNLHAEGISLSILGNVPNQVCNV